MINQYNAVKTVFKHNADNINPEILRYTVNKKTIPYL